MYLIQQALVTLVGLVAARGRATVVVNDNEQQKVLLDHTSPTEKDLYQVRNGYADLVFTLIILFIELPVTEL